VPPLPAHAKVNLVVEESAAVLSDPLMGCVPLQPPDAVHDVAFVEDHVSFEVAPLATVVGFAANVTVGSGVVIDTVADCAALAPAPLQVSV
jgi:hypothetical protein